jgi:hypothetical protein
MLRDGSQMQPESENAQLKDGDNATSFVVKPTSDSHFSWIRTRLSADSTLMGWLFETYS